MAFMEHVDLLLVITVTIGLLIAAHFTWNFLKADHENHSVPQSQLAEKCKPGVQMEDKMEHFQHKQGQHQSQDNVIGQGAGAASSLIDTRSKKEKRIAEKLAKSGFQQGNAKKIPVKPSDPGPSLIEIMEEERSFVGQGNLHGYNFQNKVLCLYFCWGHGFRNFRLATELPEAVAGKFDDLVLCYDESESKRNYCLLQAKEEIKNERPKISPQELKSATDKRFSLPIYFNSYVELREQFLKMVDERMHCIEHLILYTNAAFDFPEFHVVEGANATHGCAKDARTQCSDKIVLKKLEKETSPFIPDNSYQFVRFPTEVLKLFYKKTDTQREEVFQEFLEKLVFAVDQPDYSKLDGSIISSLSSAFNLSTAVSMSNEIVGKVWNIYSKPKGQVIKNEIGEFFEESRKAVNERFLLGLRFAKPLQNIPIANFFKSDEVIANFLLNNDSRCISIISEAVTLTAIKVTQALQHNSDKFKFPEQYFAVIDLPLLLIDKRRVNLTLKCKNEFSLVVKWGECQATPKEVEAVLSKLLDIILKLGTQKTIILVENKNCNLSNMEAFSKTSLSHFSDHCKLEDFTDETNTMLMNRMVHFQGIMVKLSDIISENDIRKLKTSVALLDKIAEDEKFGIGKPARTLTPLEDIYIERQFAWNLKYDEEFLSVIPDSEILVLSKTKLDVIGKYLNGKDMFSFVDNDILWYCYGNVLVTEKQIDDMDFDNVCNKFSNKNIHWLDRVGNDFIVIKTEQRHYPSQDQLIRSGGKVKIITGEPGIGKSYSLAHILEQIKGMSRNALWVITVNLVSCIDDLEALSKKSCLELSDIVDLLCKIEDMLLEYEKELFAFHLVNTDNTCLFFDGFDEICPSYEDTVITILKTLKNTRASIWITARPHFQIKLEKEMSCFSYRLLQFSESEQKTFLFRYWTCAIDCKSNEQFIAHFVEKVFEILVNSKIKMVTHLIGIPLQARMIAELYLDDCERHHNQPDKDIVIQQIFDILELFEKFVKKKYDIYFRDKVLLEHNTPSVLKIKKELALRFSEDHEFFAVKLLFPKEVESLVASKIVRAVDDVFDLLNVGLVLKDTDHCIFTHRTFAEYFAAKLLADIVKGETSNKSSRFNLVLEFLKEQYFRESNRMICTFFDHMLAQGSDIHKAVLNDDLLKMNQILTSDPKRISDCDSLCRNPLHLAAAYADYQKIMADQKIKSAIGLFFNYKDCMQIDKCDLLNFNILCFTLGKNYNLVIEVLDKVKKNVTEPCLVDMIPALLLVLHQLEKIDSYVHSNVKFLMSHNLSMFLKHKHCLAYVQSNMHHAQRMKAFLHLVKSEVPLHIFTANNFEFLKNILTREGFFSDLLLDNDVDLSCLKQENETIVRLKEFQEWFLKAVQTCQFKALNQLLINIVNEACDKVLWSLPGLNLLEFFRLAVDVLENRLVRHAIASLEDKIGDLFASIDPPAYFRNVFVNKMYEDFYYLFKTVPGEELKAAILNNIDYVALFRDTLIKEDTTSLDNLVDYFNSEAQIEAMKVSVSIQQLISFSKNCLFRGSESMLNPVLRCISVNELTRVWDCLGCKGDLDNFGYRYPGYTVIQMLKRIERYPGREELAVFLDSYPLEKPQDLQWSVWEHVYSLFFAIDMQLPLPPNIDKVFGDNYIEHVLANKDSFENVQHIFHLASIEQKRAICRAEEHAFLKHALCHYFLQITNEKCGSGKYLEGMQNEVIALQEYDACFRNAVDSRDFNVLLVLTKHLSMDLQLRMWLTTDYQTVFQASIEQLANEFSFHLIEVFRTSSGQNLIEAIDFSKTLVRCPRQNLKDFDELFSWLSSDQRRDVMAETKMVEEFQTAISDMNFTELDTLYPAYEFCCDVIGYVKARLTTESCIQYFKYHIRNRCADGIRALLQYISGMEVKNVRHYSLYCFKVLKKESMDSVIKFIDDKYLQQVLTSLDEYPSAQSFGYHLSVWQHVVVLIGCLWKRERIPDYFLKYFQIDNPYLEN